MSKTAPYRIWADQWDDDSGCWWDLPDSADPGALVEYIRADLHEAELARITSERDAALALYEAERDDELLNIARMQGQQDGVEECRRLKARNARLVEALNGVVGCDHHNIYDGPPPRYVQIARAALQENDHE